MLHLTWMNLEAEHQLARKFGFDGPAFIRRVAEKLGRSEPLDSLLKRSLGSSRKLSEAVPG